MPGAGGQAEHGLRGAGRNFDGVNACNRVVRLASGHRGAAQNGVVGGVEQPQLNGDFLGGGLVQIDAVVHTRGAVQGAWPKAGIVGPGYSRAGVGIHVEGQTRPGAVVKDARADLGGVSGVIGMGGRQNTAFRARGRLQRQGEALVDFREIILQDRQAQVKGDLALADKHVKGEAGGVTGVHPHVADARVAALQFGKVHIIGRSRAAARKTQGYGHVFFAGRGQFYLVSGFHQAVAFGDGCGAQQADNGAAQALAVGVIVDAVVKAIVRGVNNGGHHAGFGRVRRNAGLMAADRVDLHGVAFVAFREGVFGQGHFEGGRVGARPDDHSEVGGQFGVVLAALRAAVIIVFQRIQHIDVPAAGAVGVLEGDSHILKYLPGRDNIAAGIAQGQGIRGLGLRFADHGFPGKVNERAVQILRAVFGVVHNFRGFAGHADGGFAALHARNAHFKAFPAFGQSVVGHIHREGKRA